MKQIFQRTLGRVRSWRLKEVNQKLDQILEGQKTIMNTFADVQAGIAKLGTDTAAELAAIQARLTAQDGQNVAQADIDAAVTALGNLSASVESETAALSGAAGAAATAAA